MKHSNLTWDYLCAALVLAVSIFAASALLVPYHVNGHSASIDIQRQLMLDAGIRAGVWYPRWSPFTYYGFGSPLFNFHAPFAYYVAELPVLAGASIMNGLKAAYTFALVAAGLGMFLYGRELGGRWAWLAAGSLCVLAPYLLSNVYVRDALSELMVFWGVALLLYLLSVYTRTGNPLLLVGGSALFGAIVLTHNISALIHAALIPAYCLISIEKNRRWWSLVIVPAGMILSSFFWLPALLQRGYVHVEESLTSGYFQFASHFLHPMQLLVHRWGFGSSNPRPDDNMPLMIGLVHLAGAALGLVGWFFQQPGPGIIPGPN